MLARIETAGTEVVWHDFEQPHRDGEWSYEDFSPIRFDRSQYDIALKANRSHR